MAKEPFGTHFFNTHGIIANYSPNPNRVLNCIESGSAARDDLLWSCLATVMVTITGNPPAHPGTCANLVPPLPEKLTVKVEPEATIFKQPGCATWTLQYYASGGRRIRESTGTTDYRAAQAILRNRLGKVDRGEPIELRRRQAVRGAELFEGLKRHYRTNEQKSLDAVERRWKHLKESFADHQRTG